LKLSTFGFDAAQRLQEDYNLSIRRLYVVAGFKIVVASTAFGIF
jgi:hypothetical protein